ncbi:MAG: hypothetical protein L3J79_06555, partial [Candidatus Marinimicrobia bacterium]|nr:hypothetical protein [Candidatus Neomarinimicrobiota bacterium]
MARLRVIAIAIGRKGAEIWAKQLGLQPIMDCRTSSSSQFEASRLRCAAKSVIVRILLPWEIIFLLPCEIIFP